MMAGPSAEPRVLVVGDDPDVQAALHLHLERTGALMWCVPRPDLVEWMVRAVHPQAVVLLVPQAMDAQWARALSLSIPGALMSVVASSAERLVPLAQSAMTARVVLRSDVLSQPLLVLNRGATGPSAPHSAPAPGRIAPPPPPARSVPPPPPPPPPAAQKTPDILDLIEDELEEPIVGELLSQHLADVAVTLVSENNFYVGETGRIDSGGVFISSNIMPDVGASLELRLTLPDGRKLTVEGTVVFMRQRSTMGRSHGSGYGVRLQELPPWVIQSIDAFMKARPPLRYLAPK